jgi:hypothetical protein
MEMRVMTRAHGRTVVASFSMGLAHGSDVCWRDHAIHRVINGDADKRIVCSLTIRKSFCFDAKFSSES